jgi:hypothetical protein
MFRRLRDSMIGKTTKAYAEIEKYSGLVLKGRVLSIDPSIGSTSSMPGWAVYDSGELIDSGIVTIEVSNDIPDRLQQLHFGIRKLMQTWEPDILVYEDIPAQRHGGGNAVAHASLLKATGAILSVPGPIGFIGLHPLTWKRHVRPDYRKSDENDAIAMGYIAVDLSKWMEEEKENKKTKGKRRKRTNSVSGSRLCVDSKAASGR